MSKTGIISQDLIAPMFATAWWIFFLRTRLMGPIFLQSHVWSPYGNHGDGRVRGGVPKLPGAWHLCLGDPEGPEGEDLGKNSWPRNSNDKWMAWPIICLNSDIVFDVVWPGLCHRCPKFHRCPVVWRNPFNNRQMMIDGIPNRPLYFYQKDIIGLFPIYIYIHLHVGSLGFVWKHLFFFCFFSGMQHFNISHKTCWRGANTFCANCP